ncbi:hypothetical protein GCM10019059_43510 [Camelimonas fluminis]|nr:hypothetical protein GCM10019059_43510 [Camelimonas fluminis]
MYSATTRTGRASSSGTFGLARVKAKLTLANLAYNFDRLIFHERAGARDESAQSDIGAGAGSGWSSITP